MPFLARWAVPRMVAIFFIFNRMDLTFVVALGTVPPRCTTVGDLMSVLTIGTIPGVGTEGLRIGSVTRTAFAIGTVPVAFGTGFGYGMVRFFLGAIPGVLTGFGSRAALLALIAPPAMRTVFRSLISLHALIAEPTPFRTGIRYRMMCFFALGACPIMHTAFGRV